MKKTISVLSITLLATLFSCGPAAENREVMHRRAKEISDSMANLIKSAMQEAEMPMVRVVRPDSASAGTTTASTTTAQAQNQNK